PGGFGGGIENGGTMTLSFSTVSSNSSSAAGKGIVNGGAATLKNTVVAANGPPFGFNCDLLSFGSFTSLGHNLSSDGSCTLAGTGDLNNTNPLLGPLTDNGGPTQTHALLTGSPAIDAVPVADCKDIAGSSVTGDQRGASRPQGPA